MCSSEVFLVYVFNIYNIEMICKSLAQLLASFYGWSNLSKITYLKSGAARIWARHLAHWPLLLDIGLCRLPLPTVIPPCEQTAPVLVNSATFPQCRYRSSLCEIFQIDNSLWLIIYLFWRTILVFIISKSIEKICYPYRFFKKINFILPLIYDAREKLIRIFRN